MAIVAIDLTGQTRFGDMTAQAGLAGAFDGITSQAATGTAQKANVATPDSCYVGTRLPSAKRIGLVNVYGSNTVGYVGIVNPTMTIWIYGKLGSDPVSATDGTQLGTITFVDSGDESTARAISISDPNTYDRVWARISQATATPRNINIAELTIWEDTGSVGPSTGDLAATESGSDSAWFSDRTRINTDGQTRFSDMTATNPADNAFDGIWDQTSANIPARVMPVGSSAYIGTRLPASYRIGKVNVYGSNDVGYVVTVNPTVTLEIYGKLGSNPSNSTDGTLLGTQTFNDTFNASGGRAFTITDANLYDRVWVRLTDDDTISRAVGIAEIQIYEAVTITGNLAATEVGDDTAAFEIDAISTGNLTVTETGSDTAAFTGTVAGSASSTGDMAATETGSDTAALTGKVAIASDLAAIETGSDTAALTASVKVSGSLAVTEVGADVAALTGSVPINAALAATESGPDFAAFSGTVAVSGTLAATEIGTDTAAFTGTVAGLAMITANMAAQETGTDTAAFSAKATITSNLGATETGTDTAAFSAKAIATANFVVSEIGVDLAAFSGIVSVKGNLVTSEIGADTAAFDAVTAIVGTLDALETGSDTAAFTGAIGSIIGDLNATEVGSDTAQIFVTAPYVGSHKPDYNLLILAASSGDWVTVAGGGYIWTTTANDFNGSIAQLQAKGPDGITPMKIATMTANGQIPIAISDATEMRVQIVGSIRVGMSDLRAYDNRKYTVEEVPVGCETARRLSSGLLCVIKPSNTDSRIQDVGSTADSFGYHVVGFPNNPNGKLWIQLNGHGGKPYLTVGRYLSEVWLHEIMSHGYTVIDLAYSNDLSVNEVCSTVQGRTTDNGAGDMRLEILTGAKVSSLHTVSVFNSVNFRVEKLLNYLVANKLPLPDGFIPFDWPLVYISGHSQGAGHTYYIAKHWGCQYATHLAGPYDVSDIIPEPRPPESNIADWYFEDVNATPKERMGAFLTTHDDSYNAFTSSYWFLGWPENEMWFASDDQFYLDQYGRIADGHAAAVQSPSLAPLRAKASFDRIALLT